MSSVSVIEEVVLNMVFNAYMSLSYAFDVFRCRLAAVQHQSIQLVLQVMEFEPFDYLICSPPYMLW